MVAIQLAEILLKADALPNARYLLEASVHLPRRGTRWIAAYRDEAGRQVWKSTGQRDRTAAQAIADELEAEAKRKRAAQGAQPKERSVRVRVGSGESSLGLFTQAETAAIMRVSERTVRKLQRSAFTKLRNHPALKEFWREWQTGEIEEAAAPTSGDMELNRSEIAAVLAMARSPIERHALRKMIWVAGAYQTMQTGGPRSRRHVENRA